MKMIVPGSGNVSDDSDDDMENADVDIYRRKYQLLLERCEVLQQDNERLVHRIQQVKKLLRKSRKERKYLMDCLDQHADNWRTVSLQLTMDEPMPVKVEKVAPMMQQHQGPRSIESTPSTKGVLKGSSTGHGAVGRKAGSANKRKTDPNAPKRPANPFFQFCQEQRPKVMERLGSEPKGEVETSKQELTRQLANRWKTLAAEDKKVYYDMYERSKEKYAAEMQVYTNRVKVEDALVPLP